MQNITKDMIPEDCPSLTLVDQITFRAARHPDRKAIIAPGRKSLSYSQLLGQMEKNISLLNSMAIGRNDRVAMVIPNGPEMAVAFLSVAAAATSAPLNPAYRAGEFDFYLSDLDAKALIVAADMDSPAEQAARDREIPVIKLHTKSNDAAGVFDMEADAASGASTLQINKAKPDDVSLVLHTSGTTSRPKMVPLSHRNICTSALNVRQILHLAERDRCLNMMPLFHIHGLVGVLLSSLVAGANVVCTPGFDAGLFFEWLEILHPSWYSAVPTMHQAILAQAAAYHDIIDRCPLRFIRSSSAALPPQVIVELEKKFQAPVIEAYGMTEAAHQMASNPLPPKIRKPGSVGISAGPAIAILNESNDFLPPGEIGEIVIQGANITEGYHSNQKANASAFIKGWFRTGDLGMMDNDGYLFIKGRIKEVINRGGEKISPREIDEALLDHPDINEAIAFAVPHSTLGEDIAAAVVIRQGARVTEEGIREFCFQHLADFKVPSQVVIVPSIPKGATGKLQRIGLAGKMVDQLKKEYVLPRNDLEEMIIAAFSKVLNIPEISIHDNFFALGGDSLKGTQVISRLRNLFDVDLPIPTLFRKPTAAELAAEISQMKSDKEMSLMSGIMTELDEMSEEEARQILAREVGRKA